MHKHISYKHPPIARYALVQLNDLEQRNVTELARGSKRIRCSIHCSSALYPSCTHSWHQLSFCEYTFVVD